MTDELNGQGQPAVAATPEQSAPAVEQAPTPAQPEVAPKYGGKTLEQLASEMEAKDAYIASVNERAARAEHEALLTRNLVEQFARDRGKPQETQPEIPMPSDDEFLTNPAKVTSALLDRKLETYFARDKAERERERAEQTVYQARSAFEQGRQKAVQSNPNLFRGIETDLANQLTQTIAQSIRSGQQIDAGTLQDPKYWQTAAVAMRMARGEDPVKILGYFSQAPTTPVAPVHTEVPSPGGPPQGAVTLSPEQEEAARLGGFTREQFMEHLAKVRSETQWRNK